MTRRGAARPRCAAAMRSRACTPAPPVCDLEEHFVLADHAELGARALLDRLVAGLQVAHVGVERVVARLELRVRLALRRELPIDSRTCSQPPLPSHIGYCSATIRATKASASQRMVATLSAG